MHIAEGAFIASLLLHPVTARFASPRHPPNVPDMFDIDEATIEPIRGAPDESDELYAFAELRWHFPLITDNEGTALRADYRRVGSGRRRRTRACASRCGTDFASLITRAALTA